MPFAPSIHKDILKALDEHIIPALQSQKVLQVQAEAPFNFAGASHWIEQKEFLPDRPQTHLQRVQRWQEKNMIAADYPTFGFAYEGTAFERIGVTESMAKAIKDPPPTLAGVTVVKLPAPGVICHPPFCLRSANAMADRSRLKDAREEVKVLSSFLIGDMVHSSISSRSWRDENENRRTHPLRVDDAMLAQMGRLYMDELRQPNNLQNAQFQLLIFMCRLRRYLMEYRSVIGNSCWIDPEPKLFNTDNPSKHTELCESVYDYIQTNINQSLSLQTIAKKFDVSPTHLNRLFRDVYGTTVMRHATSQRIKVAKSIIINTPERIGDIANLTGFASTASFSTVFSKITGCSPSEYRRQKTQSEDN